MSNTTAAIAARESTHDQVTLGDVFLEYLGHRDLWPFSGTCLSLAVYLAVSGPRAADLMWFFIGWAIFVPQEWLTHVYILHMRIPKAEWRYRLLYRAHYGHHDFPNRHDLMYMPLWLMLPLTAANIVLLWLITGELRAFLAIFCGALAGYVVFEWVHLLCHVPYTLKSRMLRAMRSRHMLHHYYDENRWLAVTAFMDTVAGTGGKPKESERTASCRFVGLHQEHDWLGNARARFAAHSNGNPAASRLWLRADAEPDARHEQAA
jgi:hypothetical protein